MKRIALIAALTAAALAGATPAAFAVEPPAPAVRGYLIENGLIDGPFPGTNVRDAVPAEPSSGAQAALIRAGLVEPPVDHYEPVEPTDRVDRDQLNATARYLLDTGLIDTDSLRFAPDR